MELERHHPATGDELGAAIGRLGALARAAGCDELRRCLAAELERQQDSQAVVLVAGEPECGKSTLIGALLGDAKLLPSGPAPCTGVYVAIRAGICPAATVQLDDGTSLQLSGPAQLEDWITVSAISRRPEGARVRAAEVQTPHPLLRGGITLIDTPGVGGLDGAYGRITLQALSLADAMLFVTDAGRPLRRSELEFIAAAAARIETILVVAAKSDLVEEGLREVLAEDRAALRRLHGQSLPVEPPLLAVSARLAVSAARAGGVHRAQRRYQTSGILALQSALSDHVAARAGVLRRANALRLARHILAELEQIERPAATSQERMAGEVARLDQLARALQVAAPRVPQDLYDAFRSLEIQFTTELLPALLRELERRYDAAALRSWPGSGAEFATQFGAECNALGAQVDALLRDGAARAAQRIAQGLLEAGLQLDVDEPQWTMAVQGPESLPQLGLKLGERQPPADLGWARRGRLALSAVSPGTMGTLLLRYLGLGGVAVPIVLPAGIVVGIAMSVSEWRAMKLSEREVRLAAVRDDGLRQAGERLAPRVASQLAEHRRALERAIDDWLSTQAQLLRQSRQRLAEVARSGEQQRQAACVRLAELESLRVELDRLASEPAVSGLPSETVGAA